MYPRSFLCGEAEIKQRTPLKKELCEIGEEAIWESRFTSFFHTKRFPIRILVFRDKTRILKKSIRLKMSKFIFLNNNYQKLLIEW